MSVGMELTLLSSPLVMASIEVVCSAQSCLLIMWTVFCVNQVVAVTGTIYLQVYYATLISRYFAPSADGLRKMLEVCEEFVCSYHIRFNPAKTQLIQFCSTVNSPYSVIFIFCGQHLIL